VPDGPLHQTAEDEGPAPRRTPEQAIATPPDVVFREPEPPPPRTSRTSRILIGSCLALIGLLTVWTILIVNTRFATFAVGWSRSRLSPESIALVSSILAAVLVYLRYSVSGSERLLYIAVAFVVLAFTQLVLGASIGESEGLAPQLDVYLWAAGRIVAGVLLVVGATKAAQTESNRTGLAARFLLLSGGAVAVLGFLDLLLWAVRDHLPALSNASVALTRQAVGPLPGLTPTDLALGAAGALLYLLAAVMFVRPFRSPAPEAWWLAPALIVAAFSHLHYMLYPVVLAQRVSTGDVLRLAFAAIVLAGVAWEIRRIILSEQARAEELELLYASERDRVLELEEVERTKAELFNVLTHELAHPVATLRGLVITLSSRWRQLDASTRTRTLQRMDAESKRLRDLAEEVVSVSRLDSPGFSIRPHPERVRDLIREVKGAAAGMEDRLVVRMDDVVGAVSITIDRARILQVFRNLLSNAVKYSPGGSAVELDVTLGADEVLFEVRDRGPGIPEEDLPRLFHQFTRLHRAGEEEVGGSGLGLYISRRIVESHGGRMFARSTVGEGSVFAFTLARAEEAE
jgi:signal transduction histidine kinase